MSNVVNTMGPSLAKGENPKGVFEVVSGTRYRLRIDAVDEADHAGPRGLIGVLEFFDEEWQRIQDVPEGAVKTDRYGVVAYLPTRAHGAGVALPSENIFVAPAGARHLRVAVRRWKCSHQVEIRGAVELDAAEEKDAAIARFEFRTQGEMPHALRITLRGEASHARAAVVALEFLDDQGRLIPGPYDGCLSSPRFGYFHYLRASGATSILPVYPPPGAVTLAIGIYAWKVAPDKLSVVESPALVLDVPEGLIPTEWTLLSGASWRLQQALDCRNGGLVHVAMDCVGSGRRSKSASRVLVDFVDSDGRSLERGGDVSSLGEQQAIVFHAPVEIARRGGFLYCPAGAAAVRFRLAPDAGGGLLVRNAISLGHIPDDYLPGCSLELLGAGQEVSSQQKVSCVWQARVDVNGFAIDAAEGLPELRLSLRDAGDKPLPPKGILLEADYAKATVNGDAILVAMRPLPSGTRGIVRFAASLSILPGRGAARLHVEAVDRSSQGAALSLAVSPYEALSDERLTVEAADELAAMDECYPDKILQLAKELAQRYEQEPRVLAHLIDTYRRLGEVSKMAEVAQRAVSGKGADVPKLLAKGRHALSLVTELNPGWLPDAGLGGAEPNRSSASAGLRVGHLFKTTVPFENTGGAIRCLNIAKFQRKIGMHPCVVTPLGYPNVGGTGQPWELEHIDGVPYYRLVGVGQQALRSVTSTTQLEFTAMLTAKILGGHGVDIVQASSGYRGYEQALVGLVASRALRVPFVYEVRSYHEHTWRGMTDWLLDAEHTKRRMEQENRCMRDADAVVTICETMKEGLVDRGIPDEKVFVVPNSVDLEQFELVDADAGLRAKLGLGSDLVTGYISNVSEREGHQVLLRAVAAARAAGVAVKCLIVGAGPELGALQALAARLGISEHVVLTGEVAHEQIAAYYALIDIFVVPRVADFASDFVTPMKPFEAMAMRRPLVVSDRPALLEIVGAGGRRGMVFRAGDFMDLAAKLMELAGSAGKREALAREGRHWIETERSWGQSIRVYEQVYAYAARAAAARLSPLP